MVFHIKQELLALFRLISIVFKYLLRAVQAYELERALRFNAEPVLVAAEPLLDIGAVVHPYDLGVVHFVDCGADDAALKSTRI